MERTITGALKVPPRQRLSHQGNPYVELLLLTKDEKHYQVLLFREAGSRAVKELANSRDVEISVFGKVEQRGEDPDHWKILGQSWGFASPEKQTKSVRNNNDKAPPGEPYTNMMKQYGLVRAVVDKGVLGWVKEKDCVEIKGKYIDKLTFILAILGAKVVNAALKEKGVGIFQNLEHWGPLKEDLLGLAITDFKQGKKLWTE